MTLTRRHFTTALGASLALAGAGPSRAGETIKLSYQRSSTLLTVLKTKGTLETRLGAREFGVSWHLFSKVLEPMNTGVVDLHADVADAVPIFTQSAKAPLTFYAMEAGSPHAEAIVVPEESAIRSIADLKGRTVGVSKGSGCHFILAAALKRAGLSFADIKPAYLEAPDGVAAFDQGSLDAWAIWDPFLAIVQAKRPIRVLADATGLSSYNRYYTVNDSFAAAHPEIVEIVYAALVEAGQWVKANPREAVALLAPIWGDLPPEVVATVNERRSYAVKPVDRAALSEQQSIADTFHEAGLIPRRLDATDVRIWQPVASRG
ncbi:aliphatic sulfonate ABC transporter substrate-binding protein [Methylobacterium gnaphalii]|uniref:Putative aliphatic sulfonates-binding protein n=1 Tax=Methylobacterium gnaphalii TaxID=1010610 RepID=A0A512JG65_9HYPH|nr:aliphatic sulfonate ABC transporter substrate-binding protein [Methylobacterium gnaphalii]GEP08941.1 ABC transporter substrate-binding protein [Methylobacterium gnaphalii]GJD70964.1 Putative aliphatic sulfonates-binding protein [Methylobacterium gnaphalii]GLS50414.1 ABC transporter substrate-binding protein [Methylobacterium gnaphalii]